MSFRAAPYPCFTRWEHELSKASVLTFAGTFFRAAFIALAALSAPTHAAEPAGRVAFFKEFRSSFDSYIENPSASERQWMVDHYVRIKAFAPRFDRETDWFRDAWFYKNTYAIKPDSRVFAEHPEWILRDRNGRRLYIPYDCSGGRCPQYAGDFGNPDYRAYWIAQARAIMDEGYTGIWIDDVNMTWRVSDGYENRVIPIDPRTGELMTLDDWRRYLATFMEEIRDALPNAELAHNIIWYAGDRENTNRHIQRQIDAADYINLERGVTDRGLTGTDGRYGLTTFLDFIDMLHDRGADVILLDEAETTTQRQYALAGWLAISEGNDLMGSENNSWSTPDRWWSGYDTDMGEALGDRYIWRNLIRRDFECGLVLLNPPDRSRVSASLGRTMTTLEGARVSSVSLRGDESAILLEDCSSAPPDDAPPPPANRVTATFQDGERPSASYRGTRDATLSQHEPNTRLAFDRELVVDGNDPHGTGRDRATLISWDISNIPDDAIVEQVRLRLDVTNPSGGNYHLFQMKRYWLEHQVTWNQRRASRAWGSAGADGSGDRGAVVLGTLRARSQGAYEATLNSAGVAVVQQWVSGARPNYGFAIANSAAGDGLDFRSREASRGRPALVVTYSRP